MLCTRALAALLLAGSLAGCSSATPNQSVSGTPTGGTALAATSWNLIGTGADPTGLQANNVTLEFATDKASGDGWISPYTADYRATPGGTLTFTNVQAGTAAAAQGAGAAQQDYLKTLAKVTGYSASAKELDLYVAGELVYRYRSQ